MTTQPMTCTDFENNLGAYLEDDLDAATRAAAEQHRAGCPHCANLAADLERIATEAAELPVLQPSRDLWRGVAKRIEAPVVGLAASTGRPGGRDRVSRSGTRSRRPGWSAWSLGAAAAALVAVTAGVTYEATRRLQPPAIADAVDAAPSSRSGAVPVAVAATRAATVLDTAAAARPTGSDFQGGAALDRSGGSVARLASAPQPATARAAGRVPAPSSQLLGAGHAVYEQEITALRLALQQRRAELDTGTVAILERNIAVIDAAIQQSREALARDPRSAFLGEQLTRALGQKVHVLRTAAALPART